MSRSRKLTEDEVAALPSSAPDGTPIETGRRRCCLEVNDEEWVTMFPVDDEDDARFWEYGLRSGRLMLMEDGGSP